ncbi:MAG: hypothetical protein ACRDGU_01405 [Actinomycetota bacterium]
MDAPIVIIDFTFDQGLLFVSLRNIGDLPAYRVSVQFGEPIYGLGGMKEISALPLFQNVEFLAPGKEILTFLDTASSYFGREQPTRIAAEVSWFDQQEELHRAVIRHDLGIYREIAFVEGRTRG